MLGINERHFRSHTEFLPVDFLKVLYVFFASVSRWFLFGSSCSFACDCILTSKQLAPLAKICGVVNLFYQLKGRFWKNTLVVIAWRAYERFMLKVFQRLAKTYNFAWILPEFCRGWLTFTALIEVVVTPFTPHPFPPHPGRLTPPSKTVRLLLFNIERIAYLPFQHAIFL
jgi:hypothetical protein